MALVDERTSSEAAVIAAARMVGATKVYGRGATEVRALDTVSVEFEAARFTAIMGPSGSGKSTLLHCLAGLDSLTSGKVFIGDADLTTLSDKQLTVLRRDRIGFVFQAFNLLPTLTAEENITLPLALGGRRPDPTWLEMLVGALQLGDRLRHHPSELSGGQQQRVALARALAPRPALVLLDEPFSSLDATLRAQLRGEVRDILQLAGATAVFVTHDQAEALEISDRVAVMRAGRIEQISSPDELYLRPANRFVARFVGEANLLAGEVRGGEVRTIVGRFRSPPGTFADGERADVLLRPEQVHMLPIDRLGTPPRPERVLRIVRRVFHGSEVHHVLRSAAGVELEAATPSSAALAVGTEVIAHARAREVPVYPLPPSPTAEP